MYINYNFEVKTKTEEMDYVSALGIMLSKKQERYWKIEAEGNACRVRCRYVICPICGSGIGEHKLPGGFSRNTIEQVDEFFQPQMTLEKSGQRELIINKENPI